MPHTTEIVPRYVAEPSQGPTPHGRFADRLRAEFLVAAQRLEGVDEPGVPFDPAVHDAVAKSDGEGGEVVIDEVLRSGYRWRGQVLRPAMVSVKG